MEFTEWLTYLPPEKLVSEYGDAEKARFQEIFQPRAKRYQYFKYGCYGLAVFAFALVIFSKHNDLFNWFFGFIGIYIGLYAIFQPVCPACRRNVELQVRGFCPACGGKRIFPGGFLRSTECLSCGESLRQGKGAGAIK